MAALEKWRFCAAACTVIALSAWWPRGTTSAFAAAPPAHAETSPSSKARAAELVTGATTAYRNGDFQQAVTLLQEAYALDPQPVLLFNLGRAYEGLGDIDSAIDTLGRYLEADPKAADRGAIEQRIGTLKRQRDERIALEKQRDAERKRADEERQRAEQQRKQPPPREHSVIPYILGGVGVGGLAAGAVFGILSRSKHDSAAELSTDQPTALHRQDVAKTYATVSTISFIAGGVLLPAGVTWWVIDRSRSTSKTSAASGFRVGLSQGMIMVGGTLR